MTAPWSHLTNAPSLIRLAAPPSALERPVPLAPGAATALALWQARVGEILTVADPAGGFYRARLLEGLATVRPFEPLPQNMEPPFPIVLAQSVPNRERMGWVIQKAVELGATAIQGVITRRANVGPGEGPRQDKSGSWERIVRQAARQCRRALLPAMHPPRHLEELLGEWGGACGFLHPGEAGEPLSRAAPSLLAEPLLLLVGPEGGLTAEEAAWLRRRGARQLTIGSRVLRTETAAMAALAVLAGAEDGTPSRRPGAGGV